MNSVVRGGETPHSSGESHSPGHNHGTWEIPPGQPIPRVNLIVHPDAVRGWNLELQVQNFRFAPHHASQAHQPGEGHAHLLINGEKVTRIYGSWHFLPSLPPGNHEITVVLSTNHHQDLLAQGQVIKDTEMIRVEPQRHKDR